MLERVGGVKVSATSLRRQSEGLAKATAPAREEIRGRILAAPVAWGDETGLRLGGQAGWTWLLGSVAACLFAVDRSRGADVFDRLVPPGAFVGVFVSDFFGVYTRREDLIHAYCGAHLLRKAKEITAVEGEPRAAQFAAQLRWFYRQGSEAWARGELGRVEPVRDGFAQLAESERYGSNEGRVRLQERIALRFEGVVAFLGRPDIPFHNNAAERNIRIVAIHRQITGGCRSPAGAEATGHWLSVTATLKKQGKPFEGWVQEAMLAHRHGTALPSVFTAPAQS